MKNSQYYRGQTSWAKQEAKNKQQKWVLPVAVLIGVLTAIVIGLAWGGWL